MKRFRFQSLEDLPEMLRGSVVAIGNFDGVHRGHQSVLKTALGFARDHDCPALVLTFEPHPAPAFSAGHARCFGSRRRR